MGVLDDAIREHIELKRKHGANPSELELQEHEALGPARREATAQPAEGEAAEDGAVEAEALETQVPADAVKPLEEAPEPVAEVAETPVAEPEEFQEPAAPAAPEFADPAPPSVVDEPPLEGEQPLPAPEPPPTEPADGEDVLEATPEFLQETPEHDRLWFEQKPPRDFDFDDEDR